MDGNLAATHERYTDRISTFGVTDIQKKALIREAGLAMRGFITWAARSPHHELIEKFSSHSTLKNVFSQNFIDEGQEKDPELIRVATGKDHICSPHDPEARYANKGKKGWLGYKGQVVETVHVPEEPNGADSNLASSTGPNFITHIEVQEATDFDGDSVEPIISDLRKKDIPPGELYGDTHYNTQNTIESLASQSIEMKGPVQPHSREKQEKDIGFEVDVENKRVICPAGHYSKHFHVREDGRVGASFPKKHCLVCPRKGICQPQPRGKIYEQRPENKTLEKRREQLKDPDYLRDLHKRNGIEGTISGLVRGQNWRRSRFCGLQKTRLQAKLTGAAANISRLHRRRLLEIRQNQSPEAKMAA